MTDARPADLKFFANEYWFARRLLRHGINVSDGVTTAAERRERTRRGIIGKDLAARRVVESHPDTFADLFERLYREPLNVSRATGAA